MAEKDELWSKIADLDHQRAELREQIRSANEQIAEIERAEQESENADRLAAAETARQAEAQRIDGAGGIDATGTVGEV